MTFVGFDEWRYSHDWNRATDSFLGAFIATGDAFWWDLAVEAWGWAARTERDSA